MILQIVRFKPGFAEERVREIFSSRAPRFRALDSLVQLYYLRYPETGQFGGVFIWESEAALRAFRSSDLGRTISSAYQILGEKESEVADIIMLLHPEGAQKPISLDEND